MICQPTIRVVDRKMCSTDFANTEFLLLRNGPFVEYPEFPLFVVLFPFQPVHFFH
jgi:hypothetical protein